MAKRQVLRPVREQKLANLLPPPRRDAVFEASGVVARNGHAFVVLDNVRRVARIALHLRTKSRDHGWAGGERQGEGYEAITYGSGRFYLMIEAQKHPDGTFKGAIDEFDDRWRFKARRWVDFPFENRNTGFEGLASVKVRGQQYLLALCEGNKCRKQRRRGRGRIQVLERRGRGWSVAGQIKLPRHAKFKDFAGMALRGNRIAVVSQESSRLWIGRLRASDWTIAGRGRVYDLPRSKKGKKVYCTVEGISWLGARTLIAVSDLTKKRYPKRCERNDQSIHVFRIP